MMPRWAKSAARELWHRRKGETFAQENAPAARELRYDRKKRLLFGIL